MQLHDKIKFLRTVKDWSQEEVAQRLNMSVSGYGGIERGEVNVPYLRLQKIAEVFEVDLTELLNLDEKMVFNLSVIKNDQSKWNWHINTSNSLEIAELKHELDKSQLLLQERDKEIAYLKEMIELVKKTVTS
jgi:transcriptional regulator with XRE-family HTH domain